MPSPIWGGGEGLHSVLSSDETGSGIRIIIIIFQTKQPLILLSLYKMEDSNSTIYRYKLVG